jgi:hypothetical protein
MSKEVRLTAGMITVTEIFIENVASVSTLRKGLYFILWDYLEENIDAGADHRVSGDFLRDFGDLLEFLYALEELKKA